MRKNNYIYKLNQVNQSEIIIFTHLGLGDHIVCNGMINYFSQNLKTIYLPVKDAYFDQISYLYKNNPRIKFIPLTTFSFLKKPRYIEKDEIRRVKNFSKRNNLQLLMVGYSKTFNPFNLSFYKQLGIPYDYSFEYFENPSDIEKQCKLLDHLREEYNANGDFQLVHNQSSYGKADLKINPELQTIYVDKSTDIFKNIFIYKKVIEEAKEIHCLDSSFLHLVERTNTTGKIYFHNIKTNNHSAANLHLVKNWKKVDY